MDREEPEANVITQTSLEACVLKLEERGYAQVTICHAEYNTPCGHREITWSDAALAQCFDERGVLAHTLPFRWNGYRGDIQVAFASHGLCPDVLEEGMGLLSPHANAASDLVVLVNAFYQLDQKGIIAGAHWGTTQSSGWEDVMGIAHDRGLRGEINGIYWHEQSHDAFDGSGMLVRPLYLHWGGDRVLIGNALLSTLQGTSLRLRVPESDHAAFVVEANRASHSPGAVTDRKSFEEAVRRLQACVSLATRHRHRLEDASSIAALVALRDTCVGVHFVPGRFGSGYNILRPFVLPAADPVPRSSFPIVHMHVGPPSRAIAVGDESVVFGTTEGIESHRLDGQSRDVVGIEGGVFALGLSHDQRRLVAVGLHSLILCSCGTGEPLRLLSIREQCASAEQCVAFDRTGEHVLVFGTSEIVRWPRSLEGEPTRIALGMSVEVEHLFTRGSGGFFLITRGGGVVRTSEEGEVLWHWRRDTPASVPVFASNGEGIIGINGHTGDIFSLDDRGEKNPLHWPFSRKGHVRCAAWMGDHLIGATNDDVVEVVALPERKPQAAAPEPRSADSRLTPEVPAHPTLELGTTVRVARGPFLGFKGEVQALTPTGRFAVLLNLFGRKTTAEFDRDDLET